MTRVARAGDLLEAAEVRVASWRGAFTGLVPQDFLDAMDPVTIAASWADSIAAGRSRLYVALADTPAAGRHREHHTEAENDEHPAVGGGGEGRAVVGYVGVGPERDPRAPATTGELYALFVHPDHWGTGAGRALTDVACADLRDAGCTVVQLWVLEANTRARRFYTRYGFTETPDRTCSSLGDLPELRLAKGL